MRHLLIAFIITTAFVLTASCSSGGGGGGGDLDPPATGVSINEANAIAVAATAVNSVDTALGVSIGTKFVTGVMVNPSSNEFNYPEFIVSLLNELGNSSGQPNNGGVTGVVIPATTYPCTDLGGTSGTYTESGNISSPPDLNAGDTISVTFTNCVIYGVTLNGTMGMTITQITPLFTGIPPFTLGINVVLTGFSVNDAGLVITANGDMSILLDEDGLNNHSMELSGNSLTATAAGDTEILSNYLFDLSGNDISGDYSIDLQGTIASTVIGGSVTFVTTTTFTGNDFVGTTEPTAGVLWITTSIDNSQEWLIAQPDGINVQIDVDEDGDNIVDATIMTTWTALYAQ